MVSGNDIVLVFSSLILIFVVGLILGTKRSDQRRDWKD